MPPAIGITKNKTHDAYRDAAAEPRPFDAPTFQEIHA